MEQRRKKILIAPDKFKGSLSAKEVCEAIKLGLNPKKNKVEVILHPMADGGDGSLSILKDHLSLKEVNCNTHDPVGRKIKAAYLTSTDTAYIELASASGLVLLEEKNRNPMNASTLGTGEMILDAISKGYKNIFLFLGGSATNDAGLGIATALGFKFYDKDNRVVIPIGKNLKQITKIENEELIDFNKIKLSLFYDVDNQLYGKNGAAYMYAKQKGATYDQIRQLDHGLINISNVLKEYSGIKVNLLKGAGAAGGIAAGLVALCGAKMKNGFDTISHLTQLEQKIQDADIIISGEGCLDNQSLKGKVIDGISSLCIIYKKPLSLFVGVNELSEKELDLLEVEQIFSITSIAKDLEDAMKNGKQYLEALANKMKI